MTSGRADSYGQALQYLDSIVKVEAGSKVAVMVKRDGSEALLPYQPLPLNQFCMPPLFPQAHHYHAATAGS